MKCQHIQVPVDFSHDSEHAVEAAIGLAQQFEARVTLLHAIHIPEAAEVNLAAYMDKIRSEADQSMTSRLQRVQEAGVTAEAVTVIGAPSQTIVDTARDRRADLIVMGTHGRTGLRHMLIGSVAERVVRLAPCPVMVVPRESGKD